MRFVLVAMFWLAVTLELNAQNFLRLRGEPGEYITGGMSYALEGSDATFTIRSEFDGGTSVLVTQPAAPFHSFWLTFKPYPNPLLTPGVYENATRWPFQFQTPGLTIVGDGRGCNQSSGNFEVLRSRYDGAGNVVALQVRFEQFCEQPTAPRLVGEVSVGFAQDVPTFSTLGIAAAVGALAILGARVLRFG